jgi:hypothetical protein
MEIIMSEVVMKSPFGSCPIEPERLVRELKTGLQKCNRGHTWNHGGNKEWTDAVKKKLKKIAKGYSNKTRCFYSHAELGMTEFLLDLVWWDKDEIEGASLACECEWYFSRNGKVGQYAKRVGEDFAKLLVFKAPLKLMIFATPKQSPKVEYAVIKEINRYLKRYKHHLAGETYLVLDFAPVPKAWIARIEKNGAVHPSLSNFEF